MRNVVRGLILTTIGFLALVPIQATPALADGGLDLDFEKVNRITGSIHRVTATLTQISGAPASVSGQTIHFEYSGDRAMDSDGGQELAPNDASCTTNAQGKCSPPTKTSAVGSEGLLRIRAWHVDATGTPPSHSPCNPPAQLTTPPPDCDHTEGQEEGTTNEPDDTDVVEVTWLDGELDVSPEEASANVGAAVTFTAKVQEKGVVAPAVPKLLLANVDAEIEESTATPTNKDKVPTKRDFECTTGELTGTCSLTYTAGTGAGVDTIRAWVDLNHDPDATPPTGDETAPGATFEADASEKPDEKALPDGAGATPENDTTDVVKANISSTIQLDLSPETANKDIGTSSGITANVTLGGTPQSGIKVAAAILGGGANVGTAIAFCTTAANGQCALNYTGTKAGTDKIQGAIDEDSNGLPNEADQSEDVGTEGGTKDPDKTDVVQITWTDPSPPPPEDPADSDECDQAKKDLARAKKKLKKAKASGDKQKIAKARKRVKKARQAKNRACT